MDAILNLLPGGGLTALLAGAGVLVVFVSSLLLGARKAGQDSEKAKEARRRDENLDKIKRAADASPSGSVLDDPHNRDNR